MSNPQINKKRPRCAAERKNVSTEISTAKKVNRRKSKLKLSNLIAILHEDSLLSGSLFHNEFTGENNIIKSVPWRRTGLHITQTDTDRILLHIEEHYGDCDKSHLLSAINIACRDNPYHPVKQKLELLRWDGQERISHLLPQFLGADENKYTSEVMEIILVELINRIYNPGTQLHYIPCILGILDIEKSCFLQLLSMQDDWYSDNLKKTNNKIEASGLQGHLIVKIPERLTPLNSTAAGEVKQFVNQPYDTYKRPYSHYPVDSFRQCIFFVTTNLSSCFPPYLAGMPEFIPIIGHSQKINRNLTADESKTRLYFEQVLAEALHKYQISSQPNFYLSTEARAILKEMQYEHTFRKNHLRPAANCNGTDNCIGAQLALPLVS